MKLLGMARRIVARNLWIALLVAWFVWLRPQHLGGPAAYLTVSGTSMEPVYHAGDMVIVMPDASYEAGDIVAYRVPAGHIAAGHIVIHRITGGDAVRGFLVRGDNTAGLDVWHPTADDIVGQPVLAIPGLARFLMILRSPLLLASLAAATFAAWMLMPRTLPAARSGPTVRDHRWPDRWWWRSPGRGAGSRIVRPLHAGGRPPQG